MFFSLSFTKISSFWLRSFGYFSHIKDAQTLAQHTEIKPYVAMPKRRYTHTHIERSQDLFWYPHSKHTCTHSANIVQAMTLRCFWCCYLVLSANALTSLLLSIKSSRSNNNFSLSLFTLFSSCIFVVGFLFRFWLIRYCSCLCVLLSVFLVGFECVYLHSSVFMDKNILSVFLLQYLCAELCCCCWTISRCVFFLSSVLFRFSFSKLFFISRSLSVGYLVHSQ